VTEIRERLEDPLLDGGARRGLEWCLQELEARRQSWLEAPILVSEAAVEFGRSARHFRDLVKAGKLRAAKGRGPTRIRRIDVLRLFAQEGTE
jgi:hypothetical protein